ncbi:WecB/TagA/CpsF family glycosyltransferase [Rhodococcus rhodochrous]|uniref:WecB/TagA/CpsF family glycosyltransferase n=1 Tax=Rhodococcus rhodochrous TaxID=1829 RepID=UPI001D01BFC6
MYSKALKTAEISVADNPLVFSLPTFDDALAEVLYHQPDRWSTVITPNLHHIYLLRQYPDLVDLYSRADRLYPDGWPVALMLSRITGEPVSRIAGSDLLESILAARGEGRPMVLVGGDGPEALDAVRRRAEANNWRVFLEPAPRYEVDDADSRNELLTRVARNGSGGLVVLGIGAPKQEKFADDLSLLPGAGHILCLGMAINFSAGVTTRAPAPLQRLGLEWIHRIIQEPRRLAPRYARDLRALVPTLLENVRNFK